MGGTFAGRVTLKNKSQIIYKARRKSFIKQSANHLTQGVSRQDRICPQFLLFGIRIKIKSEMIRAGIYNSNSNYYNSTFNYICCNPALNYNVCSPISIQIFYNPISNYNCCNSMFRYIYCNPISGYNSCNPTSKSNCCKPISNYMICNPMFYYICCNPISFFLYSEFQFYCLQSEI